MAAYRSRKGGLFCSGALLVACGGAAANTSPAASPDSESKAANAQTDVSKDRVLSPKEIAERATPSVVSIKGANSIGSGFVVRKDGWIATNLHVILSGADIAVYSADGTKMEVIEVLGMDPKRDLAIVRVAGDNLPELVVGDSQAVRPGDAVVAIGHPMGLQDTVSDGLVSAVREIDDGLSLLQISAPIAPGSSGGPLLDDRGRVIGIATAVSRRGQNLNFGVPTTYLQELMAGDKPPIAWADFAKQIEEAQLPDVKREIPKHSLSLLKGCGEGDMRLLIQMLGQAIEIGAPLYNDRNFAACYHVYEGAATDAARRLGSGCYGPKRALSAGRKKAAKLSDPAAQAWAMRDAFDGLLDVLERKFER